jgi:uncharacterized protein (TIGR00159 family)
MELFKIGFLAVRIIDLIDIGLVSILIYYLYKLIRRTAFVQVLMALLVLFGVWRLTEALNMVLIKSMLDQLIQFGAIALVVVFAPEIRRFFVSVGQSAFFARLRGEFADTSDDQLREIIDAAENLGTAHIGAIIVIEGNNDLQHIEQTGDTINAAVSKRLLLSIFNPKSPLHDGAVLLRGSQIVAARCVLPISDDPDVPAELGMRHRAALGITEVSDSAAIVVSEETGKVSASVSGRIKRNLSAEELYNFLTTYYQQADK